MVTRGGIYEYLKIYFNNLKLNMEILPAFNVVYYALDSKT
jgi:hypothetical protein